MSRPALITLLAWMTVGCLEPAPNDLPQEDVAEVALALNSELPEAPSLSRDVALIQDQHYVHPTTPAFRTSADGRVAINLKGTTRGAMTLTLMKPEALSGGAPFATLSGGTPITAPSTQQIQDETLVPPNVSSGAIDHRTLCDHGGNPRACDDDDCYDLTVVSSYRWSDIDGAKVRLLGTPLTVRVSQPKTAMAAIRSFSVDAEHASSVVLDVPTLLEPMVTSDGKLLVARIANSLLRWPRNDGTSVSGRYDIVYAVAPDGADRCDVRAWSQLYPISHGHFHAGLAQRYGFAHYQLRDPEGTPIPDGVELKGTYPWIDRKGRNLFFTAIASTLWYQETDAGPLLARYPSRCVAGVDCDEPSVATFDAFDDRGNTRGVSVAGLWTHGKMVLLDNLLNNVDYGLRIPDPLQRELQLYQAGPAGDGWVRAGSGRDNASTSRTPTQHGLPDITTFNSTFIDSHEALFQHVAAMRPITVRDVVWTMHSGRVSDEVAFDDYLSPDAFILSEMSGALSFQGGAFAADFQYHDGFHRTGLKTGTGFGDPVRVQNAATTLPERVVVPPYGRVLGGARLEPVALGGIRGKGLWLDGVDDALAYDLPEAVDAPARFFSIFIDRRFEQGPVRLLTFPDHSALDVGGDRVRYRRADGSVERTVMLPPGAGISKKRFAHLAVAIEGATVRFYLNGFLLDTCEQSCQNLFSLTEGTLRVGAPAGGAPGFRGWIDELKVILAVPDAEVVCNHARGTLIRLGGDPTWDRLARLYPDGSHAELRQLTGDPQETRYACFHDYQDEHGAHLLELPSGAASIRGAVVFPEGQSLRWNRRRPRSTENTFCRSCHVSSSRASLGLEALTLNPDLTLAHDPRRQPMQPPALVYGHVPSGYVDDTALPSTDRVAPAQGLLLDRWVLPAP